VSISDKHASLLKPHSGQHLALLQLLN